MASKRTKNEVAGVSQQSYKRCKYATENETVPKSLIELHDDYLEKILQWLNLNDLMTMMTVEKRFHQPIKPIFTKKCGDKVILTMFTNKVQVHSKNSLWLGELATIIPVLRCFGPWIAKLKVIFDEKKSEQCMAIEQAIVEHCDELKELELCFCRKEAFDAIAKPFKELEVLHINHGYLGQTLAQFSKCFPKLQTLKIDHVTAADEFRINGTMPFLEHLDINVKVSAKNFPRKNVDGAISLNPQLRSLRLHCDSKPRDLRLVSSTLKQLVKLQLNIDPENFKNGFTRPIQLKFVKQLALEIYDKHTTVDNFPLLCDKLENLEVRCFDWQDAWVDFARTNDVTKLTLLQIFDLNGGPPIQLLMKIAAYWPNLTCVTIQVDNASSIEVIQFVTACKHLQRLEISDRSLGCTAKYHELNQKLGGEWKLTSMTENDVNYSIVRVT